MFAVLNTGDTHAVPMPKILVVNQSFFTETFYSKKFRKTEMSVDVVFQFQSDCFIIHCSS